MKSKRSLLITLCVPLLLTSCLSLTRSEKEILNEVAYHGIERDSQGSKSKVTAGLLNILPGIGNIYLGQWGLFGVNFLLWPPSMIWGIPQVVSDAGIMNQKETADYYRTKHGQRELQSFTGAAHSSTAE